MEMNESMKQMEKRMQFNNKKKCARIFHFLFISLYAKTPSVQTTFDFTH